MLPARWNEIATTQEHAHGGTTLRGFEDPVRLYEVRWRD